MSITLDYDIYKWLLGLDVLKMTTLSQQLPDGKVELDPSVTSYFSTGLIFTRLISKIVKNLSKTSNMSHINLTNLDSIKFTPTQASLTYNWNLIADALKQLNVAVDADVKNLIISGDYEMINELFREIHSFYHPKNSSPTRPAAIRKPSGTDSINSASPQKKPANKLPTSQYKMKNFETDAIDIEKVKPNKELGSTTTVLEFFLVSLSKHLSLTPKQAVTLLTNGFKYLAHILAKGVKGVFEPVTYWYQEIGAHVGHLVTLIEKDRENNILLVQQACRPGLLSKNAQVVEWSCKFFAKLALEFTNKQMMPLAWEWFISEHGGMQGCLLGLKRHPQLAESIISVLVQYARYDMVELFTIHLKNVCPEPTEQIQMMIALFKPLTESNFTKDEIVSSGVIDAWIETVVKHIDQDAHIDVETRQAALSKHLLLRKILTHSSVDLMCDVWLAHPEKIEEQDHVSAAILNCLKKSIRERSKPLVLSNLALMFKLLEHFAVEKNTYAAVMYKTLTFSIIENFTNTHMREFSLRNFKLLFEQNQTIPIGILLEPFLKHMQSDESSVASINVFDVEFFSSVIRHPKFTEAHALQLFYVMADVYLNNLAFYKESFKLLLDILTTYIKNDQLQEGVIRFVKAALAMFYSSEKNKRPKAKAGPTYNGQVVTAKPIPVAEAENETLKAQKRAMIIQILKAIIGLNNSVVNEKAKTFILYTHVQLKTQLKTEHKGILSLIAFYGDPTQLVSQFEKEMKTVKSPERDDESVDFEGSTESVVGVKQGGADVYNFLRGVGSGVYKFKASKIMKTSPSDKKLMNAKPDPKVEEELGMIQREFQRKKLKKIEEETAEKEKVEKQKTKLKGHLDKRKIELGVASRNKNNTEENIVFEEGSRALEKLLEKRHGLPEIELVRLEDEEERDREAVQIFLKKYHKILHYLFVSYSNVGFSVQDQSSFSKIADKTSTMNLNELWKLLSDHDCTKLASKEELHALVRLVNTELLNRHEIKNLNFQGFKEWFVQYAVFVFSRPPKDLAHMPVFVSIEALLQLFKEATQKRGKSVVLFEDPYSTEVGDKDLHAFLNDALKKDPEYPLPEAYKKVVEKDVKFSYNLPEQLQVPEKFLVCYQVLNDIIKQAIGVPLIEPIVDFSTVARAKLKVFDPTKIEYTPDHHLKAVHRENPKKQLKNESTVDPNLAMKRRVLPTEQKPKMSLELKKEVASFPYRDRAIAQEVAETLEIVLQAVEDGRVESKEKPVIKNKVIEAKEKEKEILAKKLEISEQKRKQRHEEVKVLKKELQAKKNEEEKPKVDNTAAKKKEEVRAKYVAALKEKAKDIKTQKEEEQKRKEEEEKEKKKAEEEKKKAEFKTFNAQKVEKYQKKFEEVKGKREDEDKKKKEKEEEDKKKKVAHEKFMKGIWDKDKENREKQRQMTNRIKEMVKDSGMKKVFDKYEKQLRILFKHYVDSVHLSLGKEGPIETLKFQGYAPFASDFNIFPGLISLSEVRLLFNSMTIGKETEPGVPPGITYEEFLESLMRITIKSREKLDKISEIHKKIQEAKNAEAKEAAQLEMDRQREDQGDGEERQEEEENQENKEEEDTYEEIEGTTKGTLEGLMYYMDLPEDKNDLYKKLNFLKDNRPKNWREKKNYWKKDLVVDQLHEMMGQKLGGLGLGLTASGGSGDEN